ncbi:MAG: type II secretion system F family protein [bacterium]|nr:type II secretion system F family protein [bacterium]
MVMIVWMAIATITALIFIVESGKANRNAATELVLSKAWSNRFSGQALREKKEEYLRKQEKYQTDSPKKIAKKVKEWDKQIALYEKNDEIYRSGQRFSVLDSIPLFGYQVLADIKMDGNNDILRRLTASCEHTGYIQLERDQETGEKKNSSIYAYYLLASLISYCVVGVILSCLLGVLTTAMGNEGAAVMMVMAVGFAGPAIYGYLPYDNLKVKAARRQEQLDQSFPNSISKITLLVIAGMNISKAIEETANSDNSLMNQELRMVLKEMNNARTLQEAFTRIQCRCDNRYLDKMITVITKSYKDGNLKLEDDLKEINDECWLDKKHNVRRMSESIQNKLFIPTMLMFIGILVVIVVPAMAGFNL